MNWYIEVLKKYAVFHGRAGRKEFWYFVLFNVIISVILAIVDRAIGTVNATTGTGILSAIYALAVLIPSLAVGVRRLHDTDRTGWWLLIALVPIVGGIVLIVFYVLQGTDTANRYGEVPPMAPAGPLESRRTNNDLTN